jgi:hypothetical protein
MDEITKDDLRQLRMLLVNDFEAIIDKKLTTEPNKKASDGSTEWLRSKAIRDILSISPATLQNLRIAGKIRFKKVMGTYYYSRTDLNKLFQNDNNK